MIRGKDFPALYYLNVDYVKRILRKHNPTWLTKEIEERAKILSALVDLMIQDREIYNVIVAATKQHLKAKKAKEIGT
jgi:acyl-CoA reductase-like NAD-dependent aldehyde dehydrogenase